jgi:hypothetical protein
MPSINGIGIQIQSVMSSVSSPNYPAYAQANFEQLFMSFGIPPALLESAPPAPKEKEKKLSTKSLKKLLRAKRHAGKVAFDSEGGFSVN